MLDYWINKDVISPTRTYRAKGGRRDLFLFGFDDLVRIRIVRSLRDSGVSLERIRVAISQLRRRTGPEWQREWIVSDGKNVYLRTSGDTLESLSGRAQGQLAFAVVALGPARRQLSKKLEEHAPFDRTKLRGDVRRYERSGWRRSQNDRR
jgi:DNA-binding transcriptional MerR regulator